MISPRTIRLVRLHGGLKKTAAPKWLGAAAQTAAGGLAGLGVGELEKHELSANGVPVGEIGREGLSFSNLGLGLSLGNPAMRRSVYGHWIDHNGARVFAGMDPKRFLTGVSAKAVLPAGIVLADRAIGTLNDTSSAVHNISDASGKIRDSAQGIQAATAQLPDTFGNLHDASRSIAETAGKGNQTMDSVRGLSDAATGASRGIDSLVKTIGHYAPQLQTAGGAAAGGWAGHELANSLIGDDPRDPHAATRKRRYALLATLLGAGAGAYGATKMQGAAPAVKSAAVDPHVAHYARCLSRAVPAV